LVTPAAILDASGLVGEWHFMQHSSLSDGQKQGGGKHPAGVAEASLFHVVRD
tara:strand:+ start:329 stop:484 length:156 start_codon:yes stop_codon:yes gene_type:complete